MLDVNLYTLSFVRSTNEPDKLFLIQESTGEPIYFRLRVPEVSSTSIKAKKNRKLTALLSWLNELLNHFI
jgi:hypothetical protein